jgi:Trk K+ transport system NAD-binding subunit
MAEELTARYGQSVTAIVPSTARGQGARIAAMPGVQVLVRTELTADSLLAAGLPDARGLAIVHQDDLGNFHAALRAQELNPRIRLVIAISNAGLGERISTFFADCAVLSSSQMAAPSLVAAALGEPAPSHVAMASRTMYVARREDIGADQIICGLATGTTAEAPDLLPPDDTSAGLVLAVADGTPRDPLSRRGRRRLSTPLRLLRNLFRGKMGFAVAALIGVLIAGYALQAGSFTPLNTLYLTVLDAAGAAAPNPAFPALQKVAQFLLTIESVAFLPLVTAVVVSARISGARAPTGPLKGHVIVAGLGEVGAGIVGQLHDLGIDVVGIDKRAEATGMLQAGRLGIRVIIGEAHREETLRAADIATCQAIVSVTDSDIVNLETALTARALAADPRIVVRLYDDDLAERVQRAIGNTISRSTSYLAAPAFAAAVLDHQVLRTIAVGRHVLLLAEVAAVTGGLANRPVASVHQPGLLRVIAVHRPGGEAVDWSPAPGYVISDGDQVVVLATRAGLSAILRDDAA